ncbi:hypothetical protein TNCV_324401 [Trichonephila clavipes]|nr:hypothetical protein TNCV_324401 [Trichonephila clavipes]
MDVCKCIVPSRHSRLAASPLVRLVLGEERWKVPDHPKGVLPQTGLETGQITYMVLKGTVNEKAYNLDFNHDEFLGIDLAFADHVSLVTITTTAE